MISGSLNWLFQVILGGERPRGSPVQGTRGGSYRRTLADNLAATALQERCPDKQPSNLGQQRSVGLGGREGRWSCSPDERRKQEAHLRGVSNLKMRSNPWLPEL